MYVRIAETHRLASATSLVFDPSGAINFSIDNHGRARVDGFVNQPLGADLAVRGSYFVSQGSGGPYKNLVTGKDHGKPNQLAGRLQLGGQRVRDRGARQQEFVVFAQVYEFGQLGRDGPGSDPGIGGEDHRHFRQILAGQTT